MKFKNYIIEMMSNTKEFTSDAEILRLGIAAELDATNLYDQLAKKAKDPRVRKVLLHISREEKIHISEFKTLLDLIDPEQNDADLKGFEEVQDELKGV